MKDNEDFEKSKYNEGSLQKHADNQAQLIQEIKKLMKKKMIDEEGCLLDIGCNDGTFTKKISDLTSFKPCGVDISSENVEKSKKKNIYTKICDVDKGIPFPDSSFDLIVSNQVIEHCHDTDNFFDEVYRLLKPNGYALISCPCITSFHNLGLMILGYQPISYSVSSKIFVGNLLSGYKSGPGSHVKIFTVPALRDLAKYHDFTIEGVWGSGHYYFPKFLSKFLSKLTARYSIFIGIIIKK